MLQIARLQSFPEYCRRNLRGRNNVCQKVGSVSDSANSRCCDLVGEQVQDAVHASFHGGFLMLEQVYQPSEEQVQPAFRIHPGVPEVVRLGWIQRI